MKKNETAHTIFMIAMMINIFPIAFIYQVGITDANNEYAVRRLVGDFSDFKWALILSALISFVGIIISFWHFKYMGQLNKLDVMESELNEEIEKYRQATEQFKDFQKTKTIQ